MNNSTILAIVFLMAATLLTTAAVTIVPAAYAEGDNHDDHNGDGNKNSAEDESQAALADCDDNDVERAGFDCIAVAELIEDISDGNGPPPGACEECFEDLNLEQLQALADEIEEQFDIDFPDTSSRDAIIATICEALELGPPNGLTVGNVNAAMAQIDEIIPTDVRQDIRDCLLEIFPED
jgi:hypothetical protein